MDGEALLHASLGLIAWPALIPPMSALVESGHLAYSFLLTLAVPTGVAYLHFRLERRLDPERRLRLARLLLAGLLAGSLASAALAGALLWRVSPARVAELTVSAGLGVVFSLNFWSGAFLVASLLCAIVTSSRAEVPRPVEAAAHFAALTASGGSAILLAYLLAAGH